MQIAYLIIKYNSMFVSFIKVKRLHISLIETKRNLKNWVSKEKCHRNGTTHPNYLKLSQLILGMMFFEKMKKIKNVIFPHLD